MINPPTTAKTTSVAGATTQIVLANDNNNPNQAQSETTKVNNDDGTKTTKSVSSAKCSDIGGDSEQTGIVNKSAADSTSGSSNNNNNVNINVKSSNISKTSDVRNNSGSLSVSKAHNEDRVIRNSGQSQCVNGASGFSGESLSDSLASTDGQRTPSTEVLSKTNLYIRGLSQNTCDQDLWNMCRDFGRISSTKAIIERSTGLCRGYGFVEFEDARSAERAVQELTKSGVQAQMAKISSPYLSQYNHHYHNNNTNHNNHNHNYNNSSHGPNSSSSNSSTNNQSVSSNSNRSTNNKNHSGHQYNQHHSSNSNHADPTNLYIANLPPNMSEQELGNLLSTYGPVVSTRILRDQSNTPRGVGFARMESRDKCEQIIKQLNGYSCEGSKEPLLVKFADGGNKKRHQNSHQHHHQHQNQHQSNSHHQHHKAHQDDSRWMSNSSDPVSGSGFEHQSNTSHSGHIPDLAMICPVGYPRLPPAYPPSVATGASYPPPIVNPTSAAQWIHPGGPPQPYVIPQQMIPAGGLGPSSPASLHYGQIPQLTSQMQGLQIAHPGAPVGGYLPPQHQWSPVWSHPIAQQAQSSIRVPLTMQQPPQLVPSRQQPQPPSPQPATLVQQQHGSGTYSSERKAI